MGYSPCGCKGSDMIEHIHFCGALNRAAPLRKCVSWLGWTDLSRWSSPPLQEAGLPSSHLCSRCWNRAWHRKGLSTS